MITNKTYGLSILLLFMFSLCNFSFADRLWLQNGDSISGTILSLDEDQLQFESSLLGTVTLAWQTILSFETEKSIPLVLKNGDRLTARIQKGENETVFLHSQLLDGVKISTHSIHSIGIESAIQLENELEAAQAKIQDLSAELLQNGKQVSELQESLNKATSISQLWSGSVSLLGGMKTGNRQAFDLFIKTEAVRETEREKLTLRGDIGYGETEGIVETTEGRLQSNLRIFYLDDAYVYGDILMEHDRFEDLDFRVDGTVGTGYRFWKTDTSEFSADAGAGLSEELFKEGGDSTEAILRLSLEYKQRLFAKSRFSQVLTVFPSASRFGELRLLSRTSLITPLMGSLSWDLSVIDEFDTDPRADIKKNDLSVRTGLSYTF